MDTSRGPRSASRRVRGITELTPAVVCRVTGNAQALILIGRRARLGPEDVQRRRDLEAEHKVAIHTYDWLVDGAPETPSQRR